MGPCPTRCSRCYRGEGNQARDDTGEVTCEATAGLGTRGASASLPETLPCPVMAPWDCWSHNEVFPPLEGSKGCLGALAPHRELLSLAYEICQSAPAHQDRGCRRPHASLSF